MARTESVYVVADIHGSDVCWRKLVNAARFYGVATIVVAGDITGKALVPLVERSDGRVEARIAGRVQVARGQAAVDELAARVRFNGFYPYRCDERTYLELDADPEHRDRVFTAVMAQTLRDWLALADQRLHGSGVRAIVMPGNDDGWYVDDVLTESTEVVNPDGRVIQLPEFQILGYGPSNRTPWHTTRELDEGDIARGLAALETQIDPEKPLIVATHVPPHATNLDVAPKLRDDLSIVTDGGETVMVPVGSTAVRSFLERRQPVLSLHGHIHESRGVAQVGRTLAVNPGSAYSTGTLYGAIVTLKGDKVLSHQLVSG